MQIDIWLHNVTEPEGPYNPNQVDSREVASLDLSKAVLYQWVDERVSPTALYAEEVKGILPEGELAAFNLYQTRPKFTHNYRVYAKKQPQDTDE